MPERTSGHDPRPRHAPADLTPYEIDAVHPFLLDVAVGDEHLSEVVPHVSNIEYLRWLDRAAELHADALGYTRAWLVGRGWMWFVARHEIDYRAEAGRGDALVIATWTHTFRRVKSWRESVIVRPGDERVICRARTLWVLVDLDARRPVTIPAEMAARFQARDEDRLADATGPAPPAPPPGRSDAPCTSH